jgi:hypothetical protein
MLQILNMKCKNLKIIIIIVTMSFCHIVFARMYVIECMYTYMFISINHLSIQCYIDIIQNNTLLFQNISNYKFCGKTWGEKYCLVL